MKIKFNWLPVIIFFLSISILFFSFRQFKSSNLPIHLKLKLVSKGFTSPIGMASPKDGTNRLFVIEQRGKIKIIKKGVVLPDPFLDVSKKSDELNIAYSEKGLLGLAFHPQYKTNGRFFIYYSAPCS
ncbi:MAG: PQQ-dependent sugar dehydrogenase, partial [Bacteroidota bacterium]